ncbi:glutathione synthase [Stereum hirsutum FP-91666 SS1]|uniref:glutathione synthase n=1 Tax=Stereum hirsutum (strain FP-91666) TaxID=721885 RepID=UPI000444A632|nr:glutathione synthase [Stereum hirsutum FP-91666 SS1]EIM86208.1 glutathione synthase [Stereum hirsutum FP-91666 SS1]
MSSFVSWPPSLQPDELEHLTLLATTYALSHSLLYLPPHSHESPPPPTPTSAIHAPFSLFPTPIPRAQFDLAKRLQKAYNVLYARVAMDEQFLDEVMGEGGVASVDEFTGELWKRWKAIRVQGIVQPLHLGLFRSDYLLHQPSESEGASLGIKQVEFNTISSSFGALSQQVSSLHNHLLAATGYFNSSPLLKAPNLPPNETIAGLASGLVEAHKAYGVPGSSILFVVQPNERNVFDQRLIEYELLEKHQIPVIRRTFAELATATVDPTTRTLHIPSSFSTTPSSTTEISVVYYRAGYTPTDYPAPSIYATRQLLESSLAIQCPSLALQLAGGKKVQEVLTRPGVLKRYLSEEEGAGEVRASWMDMWGLDADGDTLPDAPPLTSEGANEPEPAGTRNARAESEQLVLKPQREGGGNNIYRASIPAFLSSLPAQERPAWIAMRLIQPPRGVGGYLVRAGEGSKGLVRSEVISELGIYGWALFGKVNDKVTLKEKEVGWLVRTKGEGTDEGGVATGFSVLDSVVLVD